MGLTGWMKDGGVVVGNIGSLVGIVMVLDTMATAAAIDGRAVTIRMTIISIPVNVGDLMATDLRL